MLARLAGLHGSNLGLSFFTDGQPSEKKEFKVKEFKMNDNDENFHDILLVA